MRTTPEIRRRVPSRQHQHESSIRVVSCSSSSAPRSEARPFARRKPVNFSDDDDDDDEEEEEGKKTTRGQAVVRASNVLMDQIAGELDDSKHHQPPSVAMTSIPLSPLLPSPIIEATYHTDKARWSDQIIEIEGQDVVDASFDNSCDIKQSFEDELRGSQANDTIQSTNKKEPYLISPSSATITLQSIGRSLQWTQKFPQGRLLGRAKSRTTMRSADSITAISSSTDDHRNKQDMLAEARAGLRLLAKRREDVLQDQEELTSSRAAKWNYFKWTLFISVLVVFAYSTLGLIGSLLTWAGAWNGAVVSVEVDMDIVILMTVASSLCLSASIVGLVGSVLNSRPILAMYAFLLWPSLVSILAVGYTSYKRANLRLDLKLNLTWSRYMDDLARLRVQEVLHCCGYYNSIHQATFSRDCYPRTTLSGCKGPLYRFEEQTLKRLYIITFSIVFLHLAAIACSILCSNHVNIFFGKGLTPRVYRLDVGHVRRNAVNIIRMLSAKSSDSYDVHHLLKVDQIEPSHAEVEKRGSI